MVILLGLLIIGIGVLVMHFFDIYMTRFLFIHVKIYQIREPVWEFVENHGECKIVWTDAKATGSFFYPP